jgi:putative oxidoreductase
MKRFLSTQYSETSFNLAAFVLRLTFGFLIFFIHGFEKLNNFSSMAPTFYNFFHIGHSASLGLVIFAEVGCGILLVLGFLTRFAALILFIEMLVAAFMVHQGQSLAHHELACLYGAAFCAILLIGPGRISVDAAMGK